MIDYINYNSENNELFEKIKSFNLIYDIQNYVPIYQYFIDATNNKNIQTDKLSLITKDNLDIISISYSDITCNIDNNLCNIHCKYAPIIDPIRFMIGKYSNEVFILPSQDIEPYSKYSTKISRQNNTAYIDGFFSFLSSNLYEKGFIHGIQFYGMYIAKHKEFKINIVDDIEFLDKSSFFHKNMNELFFIDDSLFENDSNESGKKNTKIKIHNNISECFCEEYLHDIESESNPTNVFNIDTHNIDINDIDETVKINKIQDSDEENSDDGSEDGSDDESDDGSEDESDDESEDESEDESDDESDDDSSEISNIEATIPDFPVLMILMEKCSDTLDNLMLNTDISVDMWCSILMQILMTLIVYQEKFQFTHNDLHTSNIMYIETDIEFLYYKYNNIFYKVPTFGKIFKIIDFGRSIYNIDDKILWSDSFCKEEDAHTQYNFGPFFDENKKEIKNNFSFDICRLSCSLFDYFEEYNFSDNKYSKELFNLVKKWCSDSDNKNLLYNNNGNERYPEFKLYRIIAKKINHCLPKDQIKNCMFTQYIIEDTSVNHTQLMDIDLL